MPDSHLEHLKNDKELLDLRRLLLEPEQNKISELEKRFQKEKFIEEVSLILPEAIFKSKSEELDHVLAPTIESAIKVSIENDTKRFSEAIYPIMGPAIRKSIAQALRELIETMNLALEHSFSSKGLKWRLQSWQTGRPFAEVVLINSLVYRSEQVFLIHRDTGCLLQHVSIAQLNVKDVDMVSGMLTAITDFVKDSFNVETQSVVESFKIDDLTVLVESGPQALLAIIVRGLPPETIRQDLHKTLEAIHINEASLLSNFSGDAAAFEQTRPYLDKCLKLEYKETKEKPIFTFKIILFLVLIAFLLSWWGVEVYRESQDWRVFEEKLKSSPGININKILKTSNSNIVFGMRDPLAISLENLKKDAPGETTFKLEPYLSLHPKMIIKRAYKILNPINSIKFTINNQVLYVSGSADYNWAKEARYLSRFIQGVGHYNDQNLKIKEIEKIVSLKRKIEESEVFFKSLSFRLINNKEKIFEILKDIAEIIKLSKITNTKISILLRGHADSSGTKIQNDYISKKRARNIYSFLIKNNIDKKYLNFKGFGTQYLVGTLNKEQRRLNRRVNFQVKIDIINKD